MQFTLPEVYEGMAADLIAAGYYFRIRAAGPEEVHAQCFRFEGPVENVTALADVGAVERGLMTLITRSHAYMLKLSAN